MYTIIAKDANDLGRQAASEGAGLINQMLDGPGEANIILATGARARVLPGLEPDGKLIWTYREAMVPDAMPGDAGRETDAVPSSFSIEVTTSQSEGRHPACGRLPSTGRWLLLPLLNFPRRSPTSTPPRDP